MQNGTKFFEKKTCVFYIFIATVISRIFHSILSYFNNPCVNHDTYEEEPIKIGWKLPEVKGKWMMLHDDAVNFLK